MRIALIRREYITHLDGVNRFIALLAEGLAKLGHDPLIMTWCFNGIAKDQLPDWFAKMHGLSTTIAIYTLQRGPCQGDPWLKIAWDWWLNGSKLLHKKGVDAVIVNGIVTLRFRPKILVVHDLGPALTFRRYLFLGKGILKRYDKIVCISDKTREELHTVLGCSCDVIPIPMKLEFYRPSESRENVIVHIGTRQVKNPQISIEAIRILRKRGYDVKLIIIGDQVNAPSDESIILRRSISEEEKIKILCKAKALILPSSYEGFSYTSLEAMACGTPPIVSTAVPKEVVIDSYNGLRVHTLDPRDYAAALERLLTDQELWLKLSRNGREFVKQFNYIEIANKYINLIKNLYGR